MGVALSHNQHYIRVSRIQTATRNGTEYTTVYSTKLGKARNNILLELLAHYTPGCMCFFILVKFHGGVFSPEVGRGLKQLWFNGWWIQEEYQSRRSLLLLLILVLFEVLSGQYLVISAAFYLRAAFGGRGWAEEVQGCNFREQQKQHRERSLSAASKT